MWQQFTRQLVSVLTHNYKYGNDNEDIKILNNISNNKLNDNTNLFNIFKTKYYKLLQIITTIIVNIYQL